MNPERKKVFEKFGGRCAYCGCELQKGWHVDHFEPIGRTVIREYTGEAARHGQRYIDKKVIRNPERDTIENKMPACASCNVNKRDLSLEDFRELITNFVNSLNQYSVQYRFAKKYGLVQEIQKPVRFYFETI